MRRAIAVIGVVLAVLTAGQVRGVEIDSARLFTELDANADGRLDADEVGTERARLFARLVRTSDDDGNGQLTAEEFAAGLTPVRAEKALVAKQGSRLPGGDALVVLLAKMDANGDRRLVAEEIPDRFRGVFEAMLERGDADKNGRLDARELAQSGPQLGIVAQLAAARLGIDVPAELARLPQAQRQAMEQMGAPPRPDEMMADPTAIRQRVRQLLNRFDRNGDGALDADEAPRRLAANFERFDQNANRSLEGDELQQAAAAFARLQPSGRQRPRPAADSGEPKTDR